MSIFERSLLKVILIAAVLNAIVGQNKTRLKERTVEMFHHAYSSYMRFAYPADELMPLSCQGRFRGLTPSRGDVDDALGNFSLTLIDALDTLAVLGDFAEFEQAVRLVVDEVSFESDLIVSVFETNIRLVGGLLGGHLMARVVKNGVPGALVWYDDHLLRMARLAADKLLPAFETVTGVPHPRVNLKYGLDGPAYHLRSQVETCTACAGTMLLEFATLSRLTGFPVYETKARAAMDFLWKQRHGANDLMGTVLNVQTGDWIRRDSGVGAGIDSYYEYCLKAYVLLGDQSYLHRFNKHYSAVMKYVSQGPVMVDVHMHNPTVASKTFMDALLAFWPGLQVLKGDLKPAIEMHEVLYQIVQKHNFLPEAFTHDFQVHWGQHPLRPEFVESTYFLYKATKDEYYLKIGEEILDSLNKHVRVDCGFAGIKDVRTMQMEDRMDSFVLAETFKYLFLLFAERQDVIFDVDDYIFSTEAHFLPLYISAYSSFKSGNVYKPVPNMPLIYKDVDETTTIEDNLSAVCPNHNQFLLQDGGTSYAATFRERLRNFVRRSPNNQAGLLSQQSDIPPTPVHLHPLEFNPSSPEHIEQLNLMGIQLVTHSDGKLQLVHSAASAKSSLLAEQGLRFMHDMLQALNDQPDTAGLSQAGRVIQVVSWPIFGRLSFNGHPAQFGPTVDDFDEYTGHIVKVSPFNACSALHNVIASSKAKIFAVVERGTCTFVQKVRNAEKAGFSGAVIIDNVPDTDSSKSPIFAMSGDGQNDVLIPSVFLYKREGDHLLMLLHRDPLLKITISQQCGNPKSIFQHWLRRARRHKRKNAGRQRHPNARQLRATPEKPPVQQKCSWKPKIVGGNSLQLSQQPPNAGRWVDWLQAVEKLQELPSTYSSLLDEALGKILTQRPELADLITLKQPKQESAKVLELVTLKDGSDDATDYDNRQLLDSEIQKP